MSVQLAHLAGVARLPAGPSRSCRNRACPLARRFRDRHPHRLCRDRGGRPGIPGRRDHRRPVTGFDTLRNEALRGSESLALIERMCEGMESSWRKSSYSGDNGGECIEVAAAEAVLVRDTADRSGPYSPSLPAHGGHSLRQSGNQPSPAVQYTGHSRILPRVPSCVAAWSLPSLPAICRLPGNSCLMPVPTCRMPLRRHERTRGHGQDSSRSRSAAHHIRLAWRPGISADRAPAHPDRARLPRADRVRQGRRGHHLRTRHQRGAARRWRWYRDNRGNARTSLEPGDGDHRRVRLLLPRPCNAPRFGRQRTWPGTAHRGSAVCSLGLAPALQREGGLRGTGSEL